MCRNWQYMERGIKALHGFMSERGRIEAEYAMKVDSSLGLLAVLLELTTVVANAWEQLVAVGQAFWQPRTVLVTGAGQSASALSCWEYREGSKSMGWTKPSQIQSPTWSKPSVQHTTPEPYRGSASSRMSSSNAPVLLRSWLTLFNPLLGRHCVSHRLTGVASGGSTVAPAIREVAVQVVLQNKVIVGSVNANKRHWYKTGAALSRADRSWLGYLITRFEPAQNFARALER
jgi:glucose 1-dehydrogenase